MCCLSILVSLMLNTFLSSHAFFALGWLGFFGIIDVFYFRLSRGCWRRTCPTSSTSPSTPSLGHSSDNRLQPTTTGPCQPVYTAAVQAGKLSLRQEMLSSTVSTGWRHHRPREALTWPGMLFSTVSTGQRHHSPREALTPARDAQQHSLYMPETHRPPPTMFI